MMHSRRCSHRRIPTRERAFYTEPACFPIAFDYGRRSGKGSERFLPVRFDRIVQEAIPSRSLASSLRCRSVVRQVCAGIKFASLFHYLSWKLDIAAKVDRPSESPVSSLDRSVDELRSQDGRLRSRGLLFALGSGYAEEGI